MKDKSTFTLYCRRVFNHLPEQAKPCSTETFFLYIAILIVYSGLNVIFDEN